VSELTQRLRGGKPEWKRLSEAQINFLGIEWNIWKVIGWLGNALFLPIFRPVVRNRKKKQVVVPGVLVVEPRRIGVAADLLSAQARLGVHLCLAFTWIPYIRNLIIHRRHTDAHLTCPACGVDTRLRQTTARAVARARAVSRNK